MRFSGQGLMSHTSTTTISRFFERSRGKALSTIWFGLSTAEFILPVSYNLFFYYLFLENCLARNCNINNFIFTFCNFKYN